MKEFSKIALGNEILDENLSKRDGFKQFTLTFMPTVPKLINPDDVRNRLPAEIAGVAELVDAKDLKSFDPKRVVRVQVPPSARLSGD
jgi:hypothetical protein